jgi:hypothetical protein
VFLVSRSSGEQASGLLELRSRFCFPHHSLCCRRAHLSCAGLLCRYDPVFKVKLLNSEEVVWRRRHYRVRRADAPGTFYFSVSSTCRHSAAAEWIIPNWQRVRRWGTNPSLQTSKPPNQHVHLSMVLLQTEFNF